MRMPRFVPLLALIATSSIGSLVVGCSGGGDTAQVAQGGGNTSVTQPPVGGENVLFQRTDAIGNVDIYVIKSNGSGQIPISADQGVQEEFSRLVGNRVLYHRRAPGAISPRDIWAVNTDGSAPLALVEGPEDDAVVEAATDRVIYEEKTVPPNFPLQGNIFRTALSGGTKVALANTFLDEKFFATVSARAVYSTLSNQGDIFSVSLDGLAGGPAVPLAADPSVLEFPISFLDTRVIYQKRDVTGTDTDLFIRSADGSGPAIPLGQTSSSEFFAALAGNRVVFYRCTPVGEPCLLNSINADGSDERVLASNASTEFVWVVGNRVVHTRLVGGQKDLYSVLLDGSDPQALASSSNNEYVAGFSGTRVIFRRQIGSQNNLSSINVDGTGSEAVLAADPSDETFGGIVGDKLIFERWLSQTNADLYQVPVDGSASPVPLATGPESQEYAGPAGDRVIYEQCSGGCVSGGPADLFSIPATGGASPTPLGPTDGDESFIVSF